MNKAKPHATILSGVEKCERIIEGIGKLHSLFSSNSQILDSPPSLDKSDCLFFCDNSENAERFQHGIKCKYYDNCGKWDYSTVSYITSYYLCDSLQIVFKRASEYFIRKQMNGVRRFLKLDPQPDITNTISVSRYNLTHKKGNFQRRITTMIDPTNPEFKNKALYQYIGNQPFDANSNLSMRIEKNIGIQSRDIFAQDEGIRNRKEIYDVKSRTRMKMKKNQSIKASDENVGVDAARMSTSLDELYKMPNIIDDDQFQDPVQCSRDDGTCKMEEGLPGDHLESMPQKKCYVGRMTPKARKVRAARMSESEDHRTKRLAADRMRQAVSRMNESEQTRAVRLEKMRIRKQEQRLRIAQQRNARNLKAAVNAVVNKTLKISEASVHFKVGQDKIQSQIKKLKAAEKTKGGKTSTATTRMNPVFETLSSTDSLYQYFSQSEPTEDDDAEYEIERKRQFGDNSSEERSQISFTESTLMSAISSPTQMEVQQQLATTQPPSSTQPAPVQGTKAKQNLQKKILLLVANHQNSVMSSLVSLWKSGKLCDAGIGNGSTTIKVHKVVLSAVCPKLLSVCSADFFSHKFMQVNFPKEVSTDTLNAFAEYMYKGVLNLDCDILKQLKIIAKRLDMKEFSELCDRHLPKNNKQSTSAAASALLTKDPSTMPILPAMTLSLAPVDSTGVSTPQSVHSIKNPGINIKQETPEDELAQVVHNQVSEVSSLPSDTSADSSVVGPFVKTEVVGPEDGKYGHYNSSSNDHFLTSTILTSSIASAATASSSSSVPSSSSTEFAIPFSEATNVKSIRLKTNPSCETPPLISDLSPVSSIVKTVCSQPNLINVDSTKTLNWPSFSVSPNDGPSTSNEAVYPVGLFTSGGDNLPLQKTQTVELESDDLYKMDLT